MLAVREPSGHVYRVGRRAGPVWYAKYRLPDGRQLQKKIGLAWTERGRPADGYFTKRTAEVWLRERLDAERRGLVSRTRVTFAEAAEEWLRYVEQDRDCKPSTLSDYRSVVRRLLPEFGDLRLDEITPERIEAWFSRPGADRDRPLSNRTRNKSLTILGGILERAR